MCLSSDALLQHLPSYLGFSYLVCGVSFHSCSSKAQPLLLTLEEGYLLTTAPPDLERGVAPLGPSAPVQPLLLGPGVAPPGRHPGPRAGGSSSPTFLRRCSLALSAAAPDLGRGVAPLGCACVPLQPPALVKEPYCHLTHLHIILSFHTLFVLFAPCVLPSFLICKVSLNLLFL